MAKERKKREGLHYGDAVLKAEIPEEEKEDYRPYVVHNYTKFHECPRCGSLDITFGESRKPYVLCTECNLKMRTKGSLSATSTTNPTWPHLASMWNKTKEERIRYLVPLLEEPGGNAYVGHITLDVWEGRLQKELEEILGKKIFFKPPEYDAKDPGLIIETYRRTGHEYETVEEANAHRIGKQNKAYIGGF